MNAVTVIDPSVLPVASFDEWKEAGRALFARRQSVDWDISEWMNDGRALGYVTQEAFDFVAENLGVRPSKAKAIADAAEKFPSHLRDAGISFEHHVAAVSLPVQEAMQLIHTAKDRHWTPEQTRYEALKHRQRDERQVEESPLESFLRHWNRLPRSVRFEAAEMIAESHGDEIEP